MGDQNPEYKNTSSKVVILEFQLLFNFQWSDQSLLIGSGRTFKHLDVVSKHRCTQGGGGIKVYPPSKIFAKLVNKNAIKHQKGVPSHQNLNNPYIPSLPKFGKHLMDPPPGFLNRVHLCVQNSFKEVLRHAGICRCVLFLK